MGRWGVFNVGDWERELFEVVRKLWDVVWSEESVIRKKEWLFVLEINDRLG